MNNKVYDIVTARIMDSLKAGVAPWKKTWTGGGMPMNLASKKAYRGMNVFILRSNGFTSRWFLTFNQAKAKGGTVKAGSKGTPVIFWNFLDETKKGEKTGKKIPMMRYYTVFNLSQIDGIEDPDANIVPGTINPIGKAEDIVKGMPNCPKINGGIDASYCPATDAINMPDIGNFQKAEFYYSVLFHEMAHSTGHGSRLNRELKNHKGSEKHSVEELTAEMTASFLSAEAGIESATLDNSASYIAGWLSTLSNDPKMLIKAAGQAQKAADFILNVKANIVPEPVSEEITENA